RLHLTAFRAARSSRVQLISRLYLIDGRWFGIFELHRVGRVAPQDRILGNVDGDTPVRAHCSGLDGDDAGGGVHSGDDPVDPSLLPVLAVVLLFGRQIGWLHHDHFQGVDGVCIRRCPSANPYAISWLLSLAAAEWSRSSDLF